nr:glycoside hydrolase family 88 protein [Succinivibrionaceae bacterium]
GIYEVYLATHDRKYLDYCIKVMDHFINQDGTINGYRRDEFNIDHLNNGKMVLKLYDETHEERYRKAADLLKSQITDHPRTSEGVFWHKQIYPHQIWCDGLYMGAAFLAAHANRFGTAEDFDDIAAQFTKSYPHLVDQKTGLLYHAWDESKSMYWCDPQTGLSPHFWGRAMGWYVMALADVIGLMPQDHKDRPALVTILSNCLGALLKVQDPKARVWYQVLDQGERKGNYLEASGSCMITAAMLKGLRLGVLDQKFKEPAREAYQGVLSEFILEAAIDDSGKKYLNLNKICYVAGLGGASRRDGSYAYYISEPIISNEPKGLGPFLLASREYEQIA